MKSPLFAQGLAGLAILAAAHAGAATHNNGLGVNPENPLAAGVVVRSDQAAPASTAQMGSGPSGSRSAYLNPENPLVTGRVVSVLAGDVEPQRIAGSAPNAESPLSRGITVLVRASSR